MSKGRRCDICLGYLDGDAIRDAEHLFSIEHERALRVTDEWRVARKLPRVFATDRIDYAAVRAEIAAKYGRK